MPYNIQTDIVLPNIKAANLKHALKVLASEISLKTNYPEQTLLNHLIAKEIQSSSGIGDGIAIPHIQFSGIQKRIIALATLRTPVNFKAIDNKPVDIICVLASPKHDGPIHLRGLSRISRLFKNTDLCERIRESNDAGLTEALFNHPEEWSLAA